MQLQKITGCAIKHALKIYKHNGYEKATHRNNVSIRAMKYEAQLEEISDIEF